MGINPLSLVQTSLAEYIVTQASLKLNSIRMLTPVNVVGSGQLDTE
jgi:hypothetical protein